MKARFEPSFMRNSVGIWIYDEGGPRGRAIMEPIPEGRTEAPLTRVGENALTVPFTLELQTEIVEAIVTAGMEDARLSPPNTSQAKHLLDAMYVRDRLLDALIPVRTDG